MLNCCFGLYENFEFLVFNFGSEAYHPTMERLVIYLFLIVPFSVISQNAGPIVNAAQNGDWLQEIEKQELPGKLEMLRERWRGDLPVTYDPQAIFSERAAKTNVRPLYFFVLNKEQLIFPSNPSEEEITRVSKMLIPEKISEVKVETDPKKTFLYGARGRYGVIFIKVANEGVLVEISEALNLQE